MRGIKQSNIKHKVNKNRQKQVKLWMKGGKKSMVNVQETLMQATIVEGQFAQDIRQALMRKPSPTAILRNQKASALLKKLRK